MTTTITIPVQRLVGHSPNYRHGAVTLFSSVLPGVAEVVLDFAGVDFISRGFADELHKERLRVQDEFKLQVVLENVSEDVRLMMAAVARTQEGSALAQVDIPVIRLNDLREFERMLQGC
jgi:hypothetical protein